MKVDASKILLFLLGEMHVEPRSQGIVAHLPEPMYPKAYRRAAKVRDPQTSKA
jgi:hypothetical protein